MINYSTKIKKHTKTFFHKIKKLSEAQCLKIKVIKNSIYKNIKSLISGLILGHFSFQTPTSNFYKILIILQKKFRL